MGDWRPEMLPEVWAGIECTVRRIGDLYDDQIERSGHAGRHDDLLRFAALGVRTLRYPVLWERIAPEGLARADWSWTDQRLERLRSLGIRPIAGLLHHGSGPRATDLLDPDFPEKLAEFALAVARRYPWIDRYTPVNEPLTTARFSGLYGYWHPHRRSGAACARMVVNQCRGVALAMQAIRTVNPRAELVQTEDLGKTHSTPLLRYQADFENERRWLTLDLLCGRFNPESRLWRDFHGWGIEEKLLHWFLDHPCPPDCLGFNYYLTSERFLDERLERYPPCLHGGNGQHRYADTEAVRARAEGIAGFEILLLEAWRRYRLPIALTEVHIGCRRESQLRWLHEAWTAAQKLWTAGVDFRAITAWALLGAYDWDSLLTRTDGHYEPGVFDLRSPQPRPTALATMIRDLAAGREPAHPVLAQPGWWRLSQRLLYPDGPQPSSALREARPEEDRGPPILITGATGTLGRAFATICRQRGLACRPLARAELDIAEPKSVVAALDRWQAWAVINAAGYVRVDEAESDPRQCFRENTRGPAVLARACAAREIRLVTFSSDLVFNGGQTRPYVESDSTAPLSCYGRSKAEAERSVQRNCPGALVIRTSAFFGPWDDYNFLTLALRALRASRPYVASDDVWVSPTYVPDLIHACLDLLIDGESGIWHLANQGETTWLDFGVRCARLAGLDAGLMCGQPQRALPLQARRPQYSVLGSERSALLPPLETAIERYLRDSQEASFPVSLPA